jgi:chromosome segregation ATPase
VGATAARRHDPLTEAETDLLREAAQDPAIRFKLYIKFTQVRFAALDQLRSERKPAADRGQQLHNQVEDIDSLVNEINDNIDNYARQNQDMRKPLQEVLAVVSTWQASLQSLKEASGKDPELTRESRDFYFVLDTAIDSTNSLAEDAQQTLQEQIAEHSKKKKN